MQIDAYLGKCTCLVRTDHRHSSKSLNGGQRLAENLVLLHNTSSDCKAHGNGNRKTLGNKGNSNTDTADDKRWNVDEIGVVFVQVSSPRRATFSILMLPME